MTKTDLPTSRQKKWARLLAISIAATGFMVAARAQEGGDTKPPAPEGQKKSDPTDIRNSIGNLDLVRGFQRLSAPPKPGTWSTLVDQPYFTPAVRAQKNLFHGINDKAELLYSSLVKEQPDNQEFQENYLESILNQGRTSDIRRFVSYYNSLKDSQKTTAKMTRLRAEAYAAAGDRDHARLLLQDWVDAHPKLDINDGPALHVYVEYAQALEDDAEYAAAAGMYGKVISAIESNLPDDPEAGVQFAVALYRGARLSGETKSREAITQLARVRSENQTYWPAMLEETKILLDAHNTKEAQQAAAQVADLNPNELEVKIISLAGAVSEYNFEAAQTTLEELRKLTDSPEVTAIEGRILLAEKQPENAIVPLMDAVKRDPKNADARGWLAGAYYMLNDPAKMEEQLSAIKVAGGGRHPGVLYEAAEVLRNAEQYSPAEKLYLEAQKGAPWWSDVPSGLAELYMKVTDEAKARDYFEKSYKMDPFNQRTVNQIKVLGMLQKFATKESKTRLAAGSDKPAFIIKYQLQDEVLATLAVEWMEKVRPELWGYFGISDLPDTTLIEFFPSHEEFSVRTTGVPFIGTVGATMGNVIAMDVPRSGAKSQMGTFDWARVLRHEYTHVVTLAMTGNRIPHWLTEACAVAQEEAPRDWNDCQLLCANYRAGTLFKIADISWGFIRPKGPNDRRLAYMESAWIYEYLIATYGLPKMKEFLAAFHDGLTEPAAWKKVYGKTMPEMDTEFLAWAGKQLEGWGLPNDPLPKSADVDAALLKDGNDIEALYNRAWLKVSAGRGQDLAGGREDLEKILTLDPKSLKVRELLGGVLNSMGEKGKAKEMLEGVVAEDGKRPVALRTLGLLAMDAKDFEAAEKWFTKLQELRPLENTSYLSLAGIYLTRKENDKAIAQLLELERHEQADERIPRRLADLYVEAKNLPEAEAAAYRALRINPFNAINHQLMAQILVSQKKVDKSVEYWNAAATMQPKIAEFWEGLADAKGELGDAAGASVAAKKAVELQPKSKAAKWIK